mgnify:CR=1 FL=1
MHNQIQLNQIHYMHYQLVEFISLGHKANGEQMDIFFIKIALRHSRLTMELSTKIQMFTSLTNINQKIFMREWALKK